MKDSSLLVPESIKIAFITEEATYLKPDRSHCLFH
jgi:hypothetical protein